MLNKKITISVSWKFPLKPLSRWAQTQCYHWPTRAVHLIAAPEAGGERTFEAVVPSAFLSGQCWWWQSLPFLSHMLSLPSISLHLQDGDALSASKRRSSWHHPLRNWWWNFMVWTSLSAMSIWATAPSPSCLATALFQSHTTFFIATAQLFAMSCATLDQQTNPGYK